jgi:hypothetical protein
MLTIVLSMPTINKLMQQMASTSIRRRAVSSGTVTTIPAPIAQGFSGPIPKTPVRSGCCGSCYQRDGPLISRTAGRTSAM